MSGHDNSGCRLPLALPFLRGRGRELGMLLQTLPDTPVTVITGPPGIGKSALALRAARLAAGSFPDGRLYVNLRGSAPGATPLAATEVAGTLLRGLEIRSPAADVAAALRAELAKRRVLVVLDEVASAAQVRPLLPYAGASAMIMTSRAALPELDGARHLALRPLSHEDAEDAEAAPPR